MKDYATYKNKTDKIAKAGKILAFSGFVFGGLAMWRKKGKQYE